MTILTRAVTFCHTHIFNARGAPDHDIFKLNFYLYFKPDSPYNHVLTDMSTKRKSDTSAASSKRARTNTDATVQALIDSILASKPAYSVPDDPEQIKDALVQLAQYARSLEEELVKGSSKTAPKTQEQLEEAAEKIARMARSGITKQMTVGLFHPIRQLFSDQSDTVETDLQGRQGKMGIRRALQ